MKKIWNLLVLCVLFVSCTKDRMDVPLGDPISKEDLQELRKELEADTIIKWQAFYKMYSDICVGLEAYRNHFTEDQAKLVRSYTYRDLYDYAWNIADTNNVRRKKLVEEYHNKYQMYLDEIDAKIKMYQDLQYKYHHEHLTSEEQGVYMNIPFEYRFYIDNPSQWTYDLIGQKEYKEVWISEDGYIQKHYDPKINKLFDMLTEVDKKMKGTD